MNDEASSSAIASNPYSYDGDERPQAAPTAAELAERRKKNRRMFNRKRGELLDDLLRNMDILVYAELSTVYYMDCSFIRFIMRSIVQFLLLSPKPAPFPEHPAHRPVIGALLGSNLICLLCHIWVDAPSAGEATRGYLHGGLAMDFIGQKGPSSKVHLVLLDLLIVALQLVLLAAGMVRRRLRESRTSCAGNPQFEENPADNSAQDLDAEERGVRREEEQQDIEMQSLNPSASAVTSTETVQDDEADESSAHDALLANTAPRSDAHIFDAFHSGQIVLADLDIRQKIKEQFQLMKNARRAPAQSSESFRSALAARMLRMRVETDALRQAI